MTTPLCTFCSHAYPASRLCVRCGPQCVPCQQALDAARWRYLRTLAMVVGGLDHGSEGGLMSDTSTSIVEAILSDLRDRRGLGNEWDNISDDIQEEVRATWIGIVDDILTSERD